MNTMLVPPKLSNGNVIPVNGNTPVIAATFNMTCAASQPNTPITINLSVMSGKRSAVLSNPISSALNSRRTTTRPTKPNVSPMIAKTESLIASGKYPVAWTLLPMPTPENPPLPIAINAWAM